MMILKEEFIPMTRPHEDITLSLDKNYAYLTEGYLLAEGWELGGKASAVFKITNGCRKLLNRAQSKSAKP